MAKYEKTRVYVVEEIDKKSNTIYLIPPKGRKYWELSLPIHAFTAKAFASLKVGKKVTLKRFSNLYTTGYAPAL